MIYSKEDITSAIETSFTAFTNFIDSRDETEFTSMPGGKWSCGQHLDHLIKTTRPVNMALGMPLFTIRLLFGKPNRKERSYEELVEKYRSKLAAGAKAPAIFVPPKISFEKKEKTINKFLSVKKRLEKKLTSLPEEQLSRYLLPHPLLGKLTLREMLYFTIYHTDHHLANIKKDRMQ